MHSLTTRRNLCNNDKICKKNSFVFLQHNFIERGYLLLTYSYPTVTFVYSEFLLTNSFKPNEADHKEQRDHALRTVRNSFLSLDRLKSCLSRRAKQEHLSLLLSKLYTGTMKPCWQSFKQQKIWFTACYLSNFKCECYTTNLLNNFFAHYFLLFL